MMFAFVCVELSTHLSHIAVYASRVWCVWE